MALNPDITGRGTKDIKYKGFFIAKYMKYDKDDDKNLYSIWDDEEGLLIPIYVERQLYMFNINRETCKQMFKNLLDEEIGEALKDMKEKEIFNDVLSKTRKRKGE